MLISFLSFNPKDGYLDERELLDVLLLFFYRACEVRDVCQVERGLSEKYKREILNSANGYNLRDGRKIPMSIREAISKRQVFSKGNSGSKFASTYLYISPSNYELILPQKPGELAP